MNAQNIGEILDALALRFGTTGAHLWEVLVKQQYLEAIFGVVFIAITIVCIFPYYSWVKNRGEKIMDADTPAEFIAVLISGTLLLVMIISSLIELFTTIPGFFNPEFYALMELLPTK